METVNNIASSASRAIWGTSNTDVAQNETAGKEPIAGETGDVKAGEPYDKGNFDSTETEPIAGEKGDVKSGEPFDKGNLQSTGTDVTSPTSTSTDPTPETKPSTLPIRDHHESSKSNTHDNPVTGTDANKPTSSTATYQAPWTDDQSESAAKVDTSGPGPQTLPSKPTQESDSHLNTESDLTTKIETSNPAPKTLAESHGISNTSGAQAGEVENSDGGAQKGAQDKGTGAEGTDEKGTGEKYVKSSGVVAEGGDFDAGKPGAGKEADRLLEEKGIQNSTGGDGGKADKEELSVGKEGKDGKVSLKDKIKDKLHIHKKSET